MGVAKYWNRLPRNVIEALFLETFMVKLLTEGGLDKMTSQAPFLDNVRGRNAGGTLCMLGD